MSDDCHIKDQVSTNKESCISRDATYSAAVQCFLREHDRWNHWMLFFFGLVAAIFVAWQHLSETVPLWMACFLAAAVTLVWLIAAEDLRASAWSWYETAKHIERGSRIFGLETRDEHFNLHSRWRDYGKTLRFWTATPWRSLTRVLVLMVTLLLLALITAGSLLLLVQSPKVVLKQLRSVHAGQTAR